jgi:hypothetical protein
MSIVFMRHPPARAAPGLHFERDSGGGGADARE